MKELSFYFRAVVLTDEQRVRNGLRPIKTPRFDVVEVNGNYPPMECIKNPKGQIFFYLNQSNKMSKKFDRIANYYLQAKDSYNFSGVYTLEQVGNDPIIGFGNSLQELHFGNGHINPFYEYRNDGYLFIITNDWKQVEVLIAKDSKNDVLGLAQKLRDGGFDNEVERLRKTAKLFFNY